MDINVIATVMMLAGIGYTWMTSRPTETPKPLTQWNEQPGRSNPLQMGLNKHASMATQTLRRKVVQAVHRTGAPLGMYRGFENGVLELSLSGICPPLPPAQDILYDGGAADTEQCRILDGEPEGITYDAGDANTIVCGK